MSNSGANRASPMATPVHGGADLDAPEPAIAHEGLQNLHGAIRRLKRHHAKPDEAARPGVHHVGDEAVDHLGLP